MIFSAHNSVEVVLTWSRINYTLPLCARFRLALQRKYSFRVSVVLTRAYFYLAGAQNSALLSWGAQGKRLKMNAKSCTVAVNT
jgi:hypothetical protein